MNPPPNQLDPNMPAAPSAAPIGGNYPPSVAQDIPAAPYSINSLPQSAQQYQGTIPQPPSGRVSSAAVVSPQTASTQISPKSNPNSTQNTLQIAEIRDGIVIMNDGSFRAVIMVKSINFDLMSPQEQEAVEYSYQSFLNSLYFPVQVFIRSQKIDLQPYIARLDKIRTELDNMLLAMLMDDYTNYIGDLSQQTNIMDKRFYVVVPFFLTTDIHKALTQSENFLSGLGALFATQEHHVTINEADLAKAKDELRNRVQSILSGLLQCGVEGLPLDTQELIELYYDTYNPDTATRQQLRNFNDLSTDVVAKGEGVASQPHLQGELE
jgi:hypothetical protein